MPDVKLKPGDLVFTSADLPLKSGPPPYTVVDVHSDKRLTIAMPRGWPTINTYLEFQHFGGFWNISQDSVENAILDKNIKR